jgi:hypothetical protein
MRICPLLLACLMALPAHAGFDEGLQALEREDHEAAVVEFEKAAMQGNLPSAHQLGLMYLQGKGVARDPAMARKYLRQAARPWMIRDRHKLGYPDAQFQLGMLYRDGVGVKPDSAAAARWLKRAAEQGHAGAQFALAELLLKDSAVGGDPAGAFFWLSLAVESLEDSEAEQAQAYLEEITGQLDPPALRRLRRQVEAWEPEG